MPDGKKGHTYLHKPTVKSLFVSSTYELFLPLGKIKSL